MMNYKVVFLQTLKACTSAGIANERLNVQWRLMFSSKQISNARGRESGSLKNARHLRIVDARSLRVLFLLKIVAGK